MMFARTVRCIPERTMAFHVGGCRGQIPTVRRLISSGRQNSVLPPGYLPKEDIDHAEHEKRRNLLCQSGTSHRLRAGREPPVLVIQNDVGNRFSPTTIVAAITSRQDKTTLPTHVSISAVELPRDSVVLLEQIRTIDKRRLTGFVGHLDTTSMQQVDEAIAISFGIRYLEELCHGK